MKASLPKASSVVLSVVIGLGVLLPGYAIAAPGASTPDPAAKEKEFLADPDVVLCELEETTLSKVDLPRGHMASFIHRMKRENKTDLKQGRFTLANRPLRIVLGERPEREFYLYDTKTGIGPYWWGSWSLHSYHKINGKFLEFMLVENGTKIAGRPYKGALGTIKAGKGDRDLEKAEFNGSVNQAGNVSAPIGMVKENWPGPAAECEVPVGDYTANIMTVIYDNLAIKISNNYHTNAKGQSRGNREVVYGMKVRKDKPYVLDFSNKPMVVFDKPSKSQTSFSRGREIKFAAVMIDPELDIMIRGLDDRSVMVDKEYKDSSGRVLQTMKRPKSLDPKVVITRADGEIVAEGVMPFG
ncbi:MAG: hypothetical protein ACYS8I_11745 [Planctomycetota bacterium]|jgi:hypothetical protein